MPLTRGEVLTTVKYLLRESNSLNLTFTAAELQNYFYEALKYSVKTAKWPHIYATALWPANSKEVLLPDGILEIVRVLVNGQYIRPTSIPLMERVIEREYDAEWTVAAGVTIPALATSSDTALTTIGYPDVKYYIRGKSMGLSPYPTVEYTIRIDGLWEPTEPATDNEDLDFFEANKDVIVFKTLEYCMFADRKFQEATEYRNLASGAALDVFNQFKLLQRNEETQLRPLPYNKYWSL